MQPGLQPAPVRSQTQKRRNVAKQGREFLNEMGDKDYGVKLIDMIKEPGTIIQPGIVLENPTFGAGDILRLGNYESVFKKFLSGETLVTDKLYALQGIDKMKPELVVNGTPILHPGWSANVKDTYEITQNISTIPIYFLVNAKRGTHLSLLILCNDILYSLGVGNISGYTIGVDPAGNPTLHKDVFKHANVPKFLKNVRAQGGIKDREAAFYTSLQKSPVAFGDDIRDKVGNELSTADQAACFYSPDILVDPSGKTSKGEYFSHKIFDTGFVKSKHVERMKLFLNKSAPNHIIKLKLQKGDHYIFEKMNVWTFMTYTDFSNEILVAKSKDYINCTSFLAAVFIERISCAGNFYISRDNLRKLFAGEIREAGFHVLLKLVTFTLAMSNPATCKTISYYGSEFGADVNKVFKEFERWYLQKNLIPIREEVFDALNNTPQDRAPAWGLGIRDRLDRFGFHRLAKFGNAIVDKGAAAAAAVRAVGDASVAAAKLHVGGTRKTRKNR